MIIEIKKFSEGGYYYDIFLGEEPTEGRDSEDGGLCTTTELNALGMAYEQAKAILERKGKEK